MVATIDSSVRKVLSQANADQNQSYPPSVIGEHFNIVTRFLLGEIAKLYPTNKSIVKIASPFIRTKIIKVVNGVIELPEDHWETLGIDIFVNESFTEACLAPNEEPTPQEINESRTKNRSVPQNVDIVDQYDYRRKVAHSYKKPTLKKPIASIFGTSQDDATSKLGYYVSPYNVPEVRMSYLVEPKEYKYGYTMNPDDTFQYDPSKGVESEWNDNATEYLFKGMNVLYSSYVKDPELREWAQILKQTGLF